MAMDMDEMLKKIKDRQWALADIDWDAPGVETISDEFRPKLKAFMADLCWIENVGARGFAAMATKASCSRPLPRATHVAPSAGPATMARSLPPRPTSRPSRPPNEASPRSSPLGGHETSAHAVPSRSTRRAPPGPR